MRVLVTGATGFVGGWLTRQLLDLGLDVSVLCRSGTWNDSHRLASKVRVFKGDITDPLALEAATRDSHSVFHLAGLVGYSKAQRSDMELVNVEGTRLVIEACKSQRVQRLVHMSSVVAIGAGFDRWQILDETSTYNVGHLDLGYFQTKRRAEELVLKATTAGELDAVILNPATIYGPGDALKGSRKVQLKVARGKMPFYTGGGVGVVHVKDVVFGAIAAWQRGVLGERYILNSENLLIRDLFRLIASQAGVEPPNILLPTPLVHAIGRVGNLAEHFGLKGPLNSETAWTSTLFHWFSAEKARTHLGFSPAPASEAVRESVAWMRENGLLGTSA